MPVCKSTHKINLPQIFRSKNQENAFQQSLNLLNNNNLSKKKIFLKYFKPFTLALSINLFFVSAVVALPQGLQVESGSAKITSQTATTMDITAANNTIINFSSFNIGKGETVDITMAGSNSNLLARDTGGSSSQIFGNLLLELYQHSLHKLDVAHAATLQLFQVQDIGI